jgi:hypothetical protein
MNPQSLIGFQKEIYNEYFKYFRTELINAFLGKNIALNNYFCSFLFLPKIALKKRLFRGKKSPTTQSPSDICVLQLVKQKNNRRIY